MADRTSARNVTWGQLDHEVAFLTGSPPLNGRLSMRPTNRELIFTRRRPDRTGRLDGAGDVRRHAAASRTCTGGYWSSFQ